MAFTGVHSLLLIEDDEHDERFTAELVRSCDPAVTLHHASTLAGAFAVLEHTVVDCVLLDLGLPDSQGLDTLVAMRRQVPRTAVVVVTGGADAAIEDRAVALGAQDVVTKGELTVPVLRRSIQFAVERTRVRDELRVGQARYEAVVAALCEGMLIQDESGRVLEANPAAAAILGVRLQDLVADPPVVPRWSPLARDGSVVPRAETPGRRALARDEPQLGVLVGVHVRGELRWLEIDCVPVRVPDLAERLLVSSFRDVSDRVALEDAEDEQRRRTQEAERAAQVAELERRAAEEANETKSRFLAQMSHEFRTPLNAVLGFAQLLQYSDLSPSDREMVDHIDNAGRHLLELVNEILDLARIEAGKTILHQEPFDLTAVTREAIELVRPDAAARGITVSGPEPSDPPTVIADRQRTMQVLLNLLSNGIKYNRSHGLVEVSIAATRQRSIVTVRDTGKGIACDPITKVFDPFERLDAEERSIQGTGLGLAITRSLVERMGGRIGVTSTVGAGSRFWFDLPTADAEPHRAIVGAPPG